MIGIQKIGAVQINNKPVKMNGSSATDYPLPPLANLETTNDTNDYRLTIVVFIPTRFVGEPTLDVLENGNRQPVRLSDKEEIMARQFLITYELPSAEPTDEFNVWHLTYNYTITDLTGIEYVLIKVKNLDPKTSRGTVTTVQESTGQKSS